MPTTSNFGWTTPADTDLVKDGAAAIRTLGNGIDTSFLDLKGGTTGQVLSKATNTDLDFSWTTVTADITEVNAGVGISGGGTSGAVTITNSMATAIDAKGDLVAGTGADAFARLAVGANNTVLTADSSTATGLKWATPTATAFKGYTLLNTGGTTLSGSTTTVSGISNITSIIVYTDDAKGGASQEISIRLNGDTAANYNFNGIEHTASANVVYWGTSLDRLVSTVNSNNANSVAYIAAHIESCGSTSAKYINSMGMSSAATGTGQKGYIVQGYYSGTSAITSVSLVTTGTFTAGKVYIWGAAV